MGSAAGSAIVWEPALLLRPACLLEGWISVPGDFLSESQCDQLFQWRLESPAAGRRAGQGAGLGGLGGEVTKAAGQAGRGEPPAGPWSPLRRRSPTPGWLTPFSSCGGRERPGPWRVMDRGAVHLCRLRDCPPVSAASCAPPRSSWRRRLFTLGSRPEATGPQHPDICWGLWRGVAPVRSRAHSRVCMCVHMLGCGGTGVQHSHAEQVCTPGTDLEGNPGVPETACFLPVLRPTSVLCWEPASSCLAGNWISAGVPSR